MDTKKIAYVMASALVLLSFTACQAAPPSPTSVPAAAATQAPAGTAAPAVTKGGILRIGTINDAMPNAPHRTVAGNMSWQGSVYDTLTRYNDKMQPQPELAESWAWSNEGKTLTMKIRKGVKFHNGRELTAEDVELNFKDLADPKAASQMKPTMDNIASFERPDSHTLVINLKAPAVNFFDTTERMTIVDSKALADIMAGKSTPVGTGPFVWKQWTTGSKLVLERNPNYWRAGFPYLDGIEISVLPDANAMALNLEAGATDLIITPELADVVRMQKDSKYRVIQPKAQSPLMYVGVNTLTKPLDDKRVRQALNYAMPRQRFVDTIMLGLSTPMSIYWPPTSPAFDAKQNQSYPYDLTKAAALLKEAGVTPGALTIEYNTVVATLKSFAILYEKELTTLGFKVTLEPVEAANFQTKNVNKQFKMLWIGQADGNSVTPANFLINNNPWRAGNNTSNFRSKDYEDLVAKSNLEFDPEKQVALYAQINKVLLDESFNIPFSYMPSFWLTSAKVNGVELTILNALQFEKTYLAK